MALKPSLLDERLEGLHEFRTRHPQAADLVALQGYWPNQSNERFLRSIGPLQVTGHIRLDFEDIHLADSVSGKDWLFSCRSKADCSGVKYRGEEVGINHFSRSSLEPMVSLSWFDKEGRLQVQYFSREIEKDGGKQEKLTQSPHWRNKSEVDLTLCGASDEVRGLSRLAVQDWQKILEGRLSLSIKTVDFTNCPPFSDLDVHGLYWIDSSVTDLSVNKSGSTETQKPRPVRDWIEAGLTKTVWYPQNRRLVDGDMFLFADRVNQFAAGDAPGRRRQLRHLIAHEIGHFLGLDHAQASGPPSVMTPGGPDRPQAADHAAIERLYGH